MEKIKPDEELTRKVREIALALSRHETRDQSLLQGRTGIAIFFFQLFQLTNEPAHLEKCHSIISSVVKALPRVKIGHSILSGFTGIAWGVDYLKRNGIMSDDASFDTSDLDKHIYDASQSDLKKGKFDYLHGGLGAALYALQKTDDHSDSFLKILIEYIARLKESDNHGFRWPDMDFRKKAGSRKSNTYDLGIALQAILELLRKVYVRGLLKREITHLVEGAISWIMSERFNGEERSLYPAVVFRGNDLKPTSPVLAWWILFICMQRWMIFVLRGTIQ